MPTWNIIEALKIMFKIGLIGLIMSQVLNFTLTFRDLLKELIEKVGGTWDGINGIDLGYVGGLIGLDDFLNAIVSMMYIAGTFAISGVMSIFGFKFLMLIYRSVMTA